MTKKVTVIKAISEGSQTQPQKKLKVCAYARVSTSSRAQADSYVAQVEYYTKKIENNPLWEFAGVYADATVIIGLKQNPTYGRRFSPIFLFIRAFCGAKRKMLL